MYCFTKLPGTGAFVLVIVAMLFVATAIMLAIAIILLYSYLGSVNAGLNPAIPVRPGNETLQRMILRIPSRCLRALDMLLTTYHS